MKVNFLDAYNYHASYYLYIYMKLREGFFQRRGFIVHEKPIIQTSGEVVFPESSLLNDLGRLDSIAKKINPHLIRTFFLENEVFETLGIGNVDLNFDVAYDKNRIFDVIDSAVFGRYLSFLELPENMTINILPVNFGTSFTYTYSVSGSGLAIFTTYRYDLVPNFFVSGLIGATVLYKVEENKQKLDEGSRGNIPWISRQFLVDFLTNKTELSKLAAEVKYSGTLGALKSIQQYGNLFQESKLYLESLKLDFPLELKFDKNVVYVDDVCINLTLAEMSLMKYLYENKNRVCTFDELSNIIWGDNEDKYSTYALSKHLANIRKKVSEAGFTNSMLQVARKQGVILSV